MDDIQVDEAAIFEMINSPGGLVAPMLLDLAERAAEVARSTVQVRRPGSDHTGWNSDARPPGFTRAAIHPHVGWVGGGHIYSSANAPADPAVFLEDPAVQDLPESYPFLTTGLWSLEGQV
jgi:hypothetical protein